MEKNIVILSKSKKYNNYCVAGKDIETGEWIRLISQNNDIHNAIESQDLIYENGLEAQILDIVRVQVKDVDERFKNKYQPENYILNNEYYLEYINYLEMYNLEEFIDYSDTIFFNKYKCISDNELKDLSYVNSLLLLKVSILKVKIKKNARRRLVANIKYNGVWYNDITITDMKFTEKYYDEILPSDNGKNFYNIKIVVSLGELFNNNHYKLIATVFC